MNSDLGSIQALEEVLITLKISRPLYCFIVAMLFLVGPAMTKEPPLTCDQGMTQKLLLEAFNPPMTKEHSHKTLASVTTKVLSLKDCWKKPPLEIQVFPRSFNTSASPRPQELPESKEEKRGKLCLNPSRDEGWEKELAIYKKNLGAFRENPDHLGLSCTLATKWVITDRLLHLVNSSHLTSVDLSGQPVTDAIGRWLKGIPGLERLNLLFCPNIQGQILQDLAELKQLTELRIPIRSADPLVYLHADAFPQLFVLEIWCQMPLPFDSYLIPPPLKELSLTISFCPHDILASLPQSVERLSIRPVESDSAATTHSLSPADLDLLRRNKIKSLDVCLSHNATFASLPTEDVRNHLIPFLQERRQTLERLVLKGSYCVSSDLVSCIRDLRNLRCFAWVMSETSNKNDLKDLIESLAFLPNLEDIGLSSKKTLMLDEGVANGFTKLRSLKTIVVGSRIFVTDVVVSVLASLPNLGLILPPHLMDRVVTARLASADISAIAAGGTPYE